jgi:hypothetical protein
VRSPNCTAACCRAWCIRAPAIGNILLSREIDVNIGGM